jgi:hypothetical protein
VSPPDNWRLRGTGIFDSSRVGTAMSAVFKMMFDKNECS